MPMGIDTSGIQEMQGKLQFLRQVLLDEAVREAARAGGSVLLEAAKARAPVRIDEPSPNSTSRSPGAVRDAIKMLMGKAKSGVVQAKIGPRGRIKGIIAAVEYGHQLIKGGKRGRNGLGVSINVGGKVIGHVPAKPFLRPAFDESATAAIVASADVMRVQVRKALS